MQWIQSDSLDEGMVLSLVKMHSDTVVKMHSDTVYVSRDR